MSFLTNIFKIIGTVDVYLFKFITVFIMYVLNVFQLICLFGQISLVKFSKYFLISLAQSFYYISQHWLFVYVCLLKAKMFDESYPHIYLMLPIPPYSSTN